MIQKEHILGVLVGIIAITGVQIATQMQMQRIAQQVQMVQDNLSARVIDSLDEEKITEQEDSFTRDELIEIEKMFEIASSNFEETESREISLWNRMRRRWCRDHEGVWTGDPVNHCDYYKLPTHDTPATE